MKNIFKILSVILTVFSVTVFSLVAVCDNRLADNYFVQSGEELSFGATPYLMCDAQNDALTVGNSESHSISGQKSVISLFGFIPVKNVNLTKVDKTEVAVLGNPFGIKLYTEGVLVVGFSDVETINGTVNPAKESGIQKGDTILKINGVDVNSNSGMQKIINDSNGKKCNLMVKRNGTNLAVEVIPIKSKTDNLYKIGLWIRDSSAGIGTLTFYSPSLDIIAGLGHGICDVDTGEIMPFESGEIISAEIVGIKKGDKSHAGEFKGVFSGHYLADIKINDITGVYGCNCENIQGTSAMPIALKQEIEEGDAEILTTIDDGSPKLYKCKIENVYHKDTSKITNMGIKVTDKELLEKTGGIVQGMSGSPIIQNGKLIGAVTHVFVNDSTSGYGIFAENMYNTALKCNR